VPFAGRRRLPLWWIGWANALAAGLMLGASYTLIMLGLDKAAQPAAAGALLGIAFVSLSHRAAGVQNLVTGSAAAGSPGHRRQLLLVNALHAIPEGIALGGAMAVNLPFGVFLAVALAVHNVPEGAVLVADLTARGAAWGRAAALAVAANVNQVLFAVATYALAAAAPVVLPWAFGAAAGAFVYLTLSDLLPESYRQAGRTSIALVTAVALAIVVLVARWVPLP
jgi:zinc transporter ZupT